MQKIDFSQYKVKEQKSKISNWRQDVVKEFLDTINADRGIYKPVSPARMAMMLAPMDKNQLYQFLGQCKDAKNFSKYFWYHVNPKNAK